MDAGMERIPAFAGMTRLWYTGYFNMVCEVMIGRHGYASVAMQKPGREDMLTHGAHSPDDRSRHSRVGSTL